LITLHLKPNRQKRIKDGHLWAFAGEIAENLKGLEPGDKIALCSSNGRLLGHGYVNPNSLIAVRLITRGGVKWDDDLLRTRIKSAVRYRELVCPGWDAMRLIYSESDGVPGLIVDKYMDHLILQSLTAGIEKQLDTLVGLLTEIVKPESIILKGDNPFRKLEGLSTEDRQLLGTTPDHIEFHEGKAVFSARPVSGQKTGFFLDQRMNRQMLKEFVSGTRVLDLYSYSGSWGISSILFGAKNAVMVDSSASALARGAEDAKANSVTDKCSFVKSDVSDFLKKLEEKKDLFDVVILDPPALVKSRASLNDGSLLYGRIHDKALRIVKPGGILISCSCSHLLTQEKHLAIIGKAAARSGRNIRLIKKGGHSPDHPILPGHPETEYLKCWFLQCD
jgi:23S rRNA (cytosine1962-C5)-methyltransferase